MTLKYRSVLVFGPTGNVGGFIALEAHKRGAKVWLAMRDTKKEIPAIPPDVEKNGNFRRVQADLLDAPSVSRAVTESGAAAVFLYVPHGSLDFGRSMLKAMYDAGVEYIVFLSVRLTGDLRAIPQSNWNAYVHAQIEIGAGEIGFPLFTALRPGWFASNYLKNFLAPPVAGKAPKAMIVYEDSIFDNIAPEDIGAVGGTVLVERPQSPTAGSMSKKEIFLMGPDLRPVKENWELIKNITGRHDIDTSLTSPDAFKETLIANGVPPAVAETILGGLEKARGGIPEAEHRPAVEKATGFGDYIALHKAEWQAL
ncbi:NmrA domain-containing protein [Mycena chlorophos]|uniref:NmrA domain-containing protein n=1 Tax=Mycena chlorophos TaxID=658473 RepID=A0A8H6SYT1_MYCCL|nr:NmrA domain-containing protein [Mycena chlorophos]